jgi:hypothetical protein
MKTRWFFAAPGAAAIMLFAACSDADNTSANPAVSAAASPADAVLVSLQHSTDSRTVQVELSATVNNIPVIGSQPVTGNGAVDFDAKLAQAHFDVLGVGVDAVSDGTSAYARSPIFGDASWYEIDFEGAKPGLGDSLGTIWGRLRSHATFRESPRRLQFND